MGDKSRAVPAPVVTTQPDAPANRQAWSFVQMNMSLLPIARPLPVYTSPSSQLQKKALRCKPRTPSNQTADKPASISPRHQGELMPQEPSPPMRTLREHVLRRQDDAVSFNRRLHNRPRCLSDDYSAPSNSSDQTRQHHDGGYASDAAMHPTTASRSSSPVPPLPASDDDKTLVRVKRILEILDEDRCKEDTMHTSPRGAKRVRRCD